jgi:hypothetical protein
MYIHIWMKYIRNICKNTPINTPKKRNQGDRQGQVAGMECTGNVGPSGVMLEDE